MPRAPFILATAEEVDAITERTFDILDKVYSHAPAENDEVMKERFRFETEAAWESMRFCALAAGWLKDLHLLCWIANYLCFFVEKWRIYGAGRECVWMLLDAIEELLKEGAPLSEGVVKLARHKNQDVRAVVARSLIPQGEAEISLLEELSEDSVAEVRKAAIASLAPVREVPWWRGKFSQNPTASLSLEEETRLKPVFEEVCQILDAPYRSRLDQLERLSTLLAALPEPLAVDGAFMTFVGLGGAPEKALLVGVVMLLREGGTNALLTLFRRWSKEKLGFLQGERAGKIIAALPKEKRRAVCFALLDFIKEAPPEERARLEENPAYLASQAIKVGWLPGEEDAPLLDALLSIPPLESGKTDYVTGGITDALCSPGVNVGPFLDRLLEAHLSGYSGPWKKQRLLVLKLLERAPREVLRPLAEEALRSPEEGWVRWGMSQLIGQLNDPSRDGEPVVLLGRFLEEPRLRTILIKHQEQRALPYLRRELREGKHGLQEVIWVMEHIRSLYGGFLTSPDVLLFEEEKLKELEKRQRAIEGFLGPEELRGPPTEEEWQCYRALRDAEPLQKETSSSVLRLFPPGPLCPADRAFLTRALAYWRDHRDELDFHLLFLLAVIAEAPEDLMAFEEILKDRWESFERKKTSLLLPILWDLFLGIRKKLGCPPPTPEELSARRHEWMDEPEEEDDL